MSLYINKGNRKFIILQNNNKVVFEPLQVLDLNEKDYNRIKGFKEIQPIIKKDEKKKVKEDKKEVKEEEINKK